MHKDRSPEASALWREAGRGFARLFQSAAAFASWQTPSASLALSGIGFPDLNCGVVDAGETVEEDVLAMANRLRERALPGLLLLSDAAGADARTVAEAAGLVSVGRMPLMALSARHLDEPSTRLTVRRVVNAPDLSAANRVMAEAFDLPGEAVEQAFPAAILEVCDVQVFLVLDGEKPVGALQATLGEGITGIWSMSTLPEYRRQGIARTGLGHVLNERFAMGCQAALLIATEAGKPLYDAFGFRVEEWCDVWLCNPEGPEA